MYELIRLSEKCFYIQSPAKTGVIMTGEDQVCLIDSGNDKSAGKKIVRVLDANGWSLQAIFNTHSHADHVGGNRCLQSRTGCKVYAPGIELAFTKKPVLPLSTVSRQPGTLVVITGRPFAALSRFTFDIPS